MICNNFEAVTLTPALERNIWVEVLYSQNYFSWCLLFVLCGRTVHQRSFDFTSFVAVILLRFKTFCTYRSFYKSTRMVENDLSSFPNSSNGENTLSLIFVLRTELISIQEIFQGLNDLATDTMGTFKLDTEVALASINVSRCANISQLLKVTQTMRL